MPATIQLHKQLSALRRCIMDVYVSTLFWICMFLLYFGSFENTALDLILLLGEDHTCWEKTEQIATKLDNYQMSYFY